MNRSVDGPEGPTGAGLDPARSEISPGGRTRPVPPAFEYIQVNGCKTPGCINFGVPPMEGPIRSGQKTGGDGYQIINVGSTDLRCTRCMKFSRLKSNKGIFEERQRQGAYLWVKTPLCCPNESCANHQPDRHSADRLFRKYGKTHSGSDRWQCCLCKKTFSIGKPTRGHKKPHVNLLAFKLLVNKTPISRMMEIMELGAPSVYGKIDFIFDQCRLFAASREMRLPGMKFDRLYLSTDRQDYMVNWGDRSARKSVQLTAIATADQDSGYLFGFSPNFDASMNPEDLEEAVAKAGDESKPYAMREYARLWTESDYRTSKFRAATGSAQTARNDLDAPELMGDRQQLPSKGVQVHADYLMHGHYWLLRYLLGGASKLRFFVDGDAGLLNACMGAFTDWVADRRADVVVVQIDKDLNVNQRQKKFADAKAWLAAEAKRFPDRSLKEAKTLILAEMIAGVRSKHADPDRALSSAWIRYPFPDLGEPEKKFRYVTDYGDYDGEHTANLLMKATLWPVDVAFNRVRRRLAYCERPIRSNRRANGLWQIYAPYDPAMIEKLLFIYRVWHNFVWVSPKTGRTAAEQLGLAAGKIRPQDILYFDVRSALL